MASFPKPGKMRNRGRISYPKVDAMIVSKAQRNAALNESELL